MKVFFLGTNGWYDAPTGNTPCVLIESEKHIIILDAGNGIFKIDRFAKLDKPAYLFLSHFHLDHIEGLHIISKFKFIKGLSICGNKGIESILNRIVSDPFTVPFEKLDFNTRFIELTGENRNLPFKTKCLPLNHSSATLGFRFEIDGQIVAYCTDTGYCENAIELARDADLLIAECSFKPGQEDADGSHLNPEKAAKIAKETNAKKLVLMHFDAAVYKTLAERDVAEKAARKIFNNTIAAKDEMMVEIQ